MLHGFRRRHFSAERGPHMLLHGNWPEAWPGFLTIRTWRREVSATSWSIRDIECVVLLQVDHIGRFTTLHSCSICNSFGTLCCPYNRLPYAFARIFTFQTLSVSIRSSLPCAQCQGTAVMNQWPSAASATIGDHPTMPSENAEDIYEIPALYFRDMTHCVLPVTGNRGRTYLPMYVLQGHCFPFTSLGVANVLVFGYGEVGELFDGPVHNSQRCDVCYVVFAA